MLKAKLGFFREHSKSLKRAVNIFFFSAILLRMGFDPAVSKTAFYELILGGLFFAGLGYAYLRFAKDPRANRIFNLGFAFGLLYSAVSTALFIAYLINTEIPRLKLFGRFAYLGTIVFLMVRYVQGRSRIGTNLILACFFGSLPYLALQLQTPYKAALPFFFLLATLSDRLFGFGEIRVFRTNVSKFFVFSFLLYALLPWFYGGFRAPMADFADGFFLQGIPICAFILFLTIRYQTWEELVEKSVGTLFILSGFFLFAALLFFSIQNGFLSLIFVKKTILAGTNTNDIATLLSLSIPWVVHGFFNSKSWKGKVFFLISLGLLSAAAFVIHVRGLYIAFFATVFIFFFLKFISEKLRLLYVGILLVGLLIFSWVFFHNFKLPLFDNFHSLWARTLLWRLAVRALMDNWLFGIGEFQYKGLLVWGDPQDLPPGIFMQEDLGRIHVHNLFLQVGLNWGILPVLGLIGCFLCALSPFLESDRIKFQSKSFGFRIALFCFGIYSLANYSFNIPGLHMAFSLLLLASLPVDKARNAAPNLKFLSHGIGKWGLIGLTTAFILSACVLLQIQYLHSSEIALTKGFRYRNLLNDLVLDERVLSEGKVPLLRNSYEISEKLVALFPKDAIFLQENAELNRVLFKKTGDESYLNLAVKRFEGCVGTSSNPWSCYKRLEELAPANNALYRENMKKFNPFALPLEKSSPF
ncbi:O-antigen ligase [Leptospira inadai serovar Lyme str. 10]|uniref:O-antigen ligase n=2 Tax=Leptospira inadai serovar Lyme TaxID=293084 RepID=V6HBP7_9LEPT|nr:O-antigen ligase family protein [Leptospira inadai]EQA36098.1 O-antigen ligase [Leptospira inadai serovar Lyme str. 10]PNV74926.1 polymerase [Leptospira inadai serovar Lyme]